MAKDLLFLLLRASITASLSDRETFIEKVSGIIEHKMHRDPKSARQLSNQLAGIMEGLNGTLLLQQLFIPKRDKKLNKTLDDITIAVEKLNTLLEEAGLPDNSIPKTDKE